MNKLLYALGLILIAFNISAQTISVLETKKIIGVEPGEFYFPKFSPDNSKIFFTTAGYKGLYYFNVNNQQINKITDEDGAGYEFKISDGGNSVYYRTDNFINGRKFSSLKLFNLASGSIEVIENEKRDLSTPLLTNSGKVTYAVAGNLIQTGINSASPAVNELFVYNENSRIIVVENGVKKILAPNGEEGHYIWPSLSPDGTKILFTHAGRGTFICDLNGNIINELGYANAPHFSPDGRFVLYMNDKDDGEKIIASDIYIKNLNDGTLSRITNTDNLIEMYPEWSSDGNKIAFHTANGEIYIINLQID